MPIVAQSPQTSSDRTQLQRSLNLLSEDAKTFLRDLYNARYGIDYSKDNQSNTLIAGNDTLNGDAGADLILGDNSTFMLPIVNRQIDTSFDLTKGYLDNSNDSYNFFHALPHQADVIYRKPDLGLTRLAEDTITGRRGQRHSVWQPQQRSASRGRRRRFLVWRWRCRHPRRRHGHKHGAPQHQP